METKIYNFFTTTLAISFLLTSCEGQDSYVTYDEWDQDEDEVISDKEFYDGITATGYHANWDLNSDNNVTDEEVLRGFYRIWDTDGDGVIDQAEWQANIPENAEEFSDMEAWEIDQEEGLSYEEFAETLAGTEFYERLDENMDDEISEEELSNSLYYIWDNDGDGYVEAAEYEEWYDKYYDASLN